MVYMFLGINTKPSTSLYLSSSTHCCTTSQNSLNFHWFVNQAMGKLSATERNTFRSKSVMASESMNRIKYLFFHFFLNVGQRTLIIFHVRRQFLNLFQWGEIVNENTVMDIGHYQTIFRENFWYLKIYGLVVNSVLNIIIPLAIIFYLNMRVYRYSRLQMDMGNGILVSGDDSIISGAISISM